MGICKSTKNKTINSNGNGNGTNHNYYESELEKLKQIHQQQLTIEKIKNESLLAIEKIKFDTEISKKDLERQIELKELENKHLQLQVNHNSGITNQTNNTMNNYINTKVKISKIQYLNLNFGNVIDINTFIDNYKNKYGLTNDQALTLLENYQNDGINSCISSLVHYLKKSAIQQYKDLQGREISMNDIILPFLLSDKSLREHFEKSINGKWDKTTMVENIKKIITITNDMVYKHHNKYIDLNGNQKKRLINGVLKASGYSSLSQISSPNLYKLEKSEDTKEIKGTPSNQTNNLVQPNTEEDDEEEYDEEEYDEEEYDEEEYDEEEYDSELEEEEDYLC
jgi:hypothetical protein